ncbi:MAG TPA: hypothetical protein VLB76_29380 [Thermoanaerobaculia bacterium]|nr:hypothetical protein [Thermoanaerobaculia bacterium]
MSHDVFQNGFLLQVGYYPDVADSDARFQKLREAVHGNYERKEQLDESFARWEGIRATIEGFLDTLTEQFGLIMSEEYGEERKQVGEALEAISGFVIRFREGLAEEREMNGFWIAADTVRHLLRGMGRDRARYVLDIDPTLVSRVHRLA